MGQYSFATNLKKERTNRGITQHELATGVHVAQNTVSDWEQCKSYPSIDKIYDIAEPEHGCSDQNYPYNPENYQPGSSV
jgi:DNA-binding XRE family transcriptional regulator